MTRMSELMRSYDVPLRHTDGSVVIDQKLGPASVVLLEPESLGLPTARRILVDECALLPLPPENQARNERVWDEFGDDAKTLEIITDTTLLLDGMTTAILRKKVVSAKALILNIMFARPDSYIERRSLDRVISAGLPLRHLDANREFARLPILETLQLPKWYHRPLHNMVILDRREDP